MSQLPPTDVPAASLLSQLTSRTRPNWLVPFPDPSIDKMVRMVVLTQDEQTSAARDATAKTRALFAKAAAAGKEEERGYLDVYQNLAVTELLWRCCKDPDDSEMKRALFLRKEDIGQYLSPDEAAALARAYQIGAQRVSPWIAGLSPEEMEAWIERLEDGAAALPFGQLSPETAIHLWIYTAVQLRTLRMEKSSAGSPSNGTSSDLPTESVATVDAPG